MSRSFSPSPNAATFSRETFISAHSFSSAAALPAFGLTNSMNRGCDVATFTRPLNFSRMTGRTSLMRAGVSIARNLGESKSSHRDSFSPTASSRTGQLRKVW